MNGDKFDNRISNLKYMTRSEHRKFDGANNSGMLNGKPQKLECNKCIDLSYQDKEGYRGHHKWKNA